MAGSRVVVQYVFYLCLVVTSLAFAVPKKRVVNGQQAIQHAHPYMASIEVKFGMIWQPLCGGALIASNKVLTAAHCLHGKQKADLRLRFGLTNLYAAPSVFDQWSSVSSYVLHEDFKSTDNDLAVIYLSQPVRLSAAVQIAALPPKESMFANSKCVLMGWGRTSGGGESSRDLLEARVTALTTSECKAKYSGGNISLDNICVYDASARMGYKVSACNADSGGPLMCGSNFEYLAGILSFGSKSCNGNLPSVYMRVTQYLDWIASH